VPEIETVHIHAAAVCNAPLATSLDTAPHCLVGRMLSDPSSRRRSTACDSPLDTTVRASHSAQS
jgi:hypothetical protein